MDEFNTFSLSRGRGVRFDNDSVNRGVGHSQFMAERRTVAGLGLSPDSSPVSGSARAVPHTSTPNSEHNAIHQLTDMMGQLGAQIGESIVAKILSAGVANTSGISQTSSATQNVHSNVEGLQTPHVTVHVKSDKGLQTFRGDGTDKYSIKDWIDLTKTHLRKQDVPVHDQAEEIMSHLMGKAKDVVKIALRSDPTIDVKRKPELIYSVLLHYFSEAPSCLPLADFYATLPRHRENPVDYWIRLNKAADLALEGLHRQGKRTENMSDEVALMFVKHCPDQELSYTLKCKPIHEWTSLDVQLRIDDYQSELRARGRSGGAAELKSHIASITSERPSPPSPCLAAFEQHHDLKPSPSPLQTQHPACLPPCPSPAAAPAQGQSHHALDYSSVPAVAQNLQQSEERLLARMVDMFQDMMEKMQHRDASRPTRGGRFQRPIRDRRPREASCRVCNDASHTTISHCMSERLCFACFSPGHVRLDCPANTSSQPQSEGN